MFNRKNLFFIVLLKFFAVILITNSHYGSIYPISSIATGGMIGNLIFLSVSGYTLFNIKDNFVKWYTKRITRIYPSLFVVMSIFVIFGIFSISSLDNFISLFIFPTYYHFIASIVLLYIVFYIIFQIHFFHKNPEYVLFLTILMKLITYIFFYDKSYYHVDVVEESFIRFLFFEAMVIGAILRKNSKIMSSNNSLLVFVFGTIVYLFTKISFDNALLHMNLQILNQFTLLILIIGLLDFIYSLKSYLQKLPSIIQNTINFVSTLTLEIYFVQYLVFRISFLMNMIFPLNFLLVSLSILGGAFLVFVFVESIKLIPIFIRFHRKKTV